MGAMDPVAEALAPWKVEEYLNNTDYSVATDYVPSNFALEFVTFIKLVNGKEGEEHMTPLVHYRMLDTLTDGGGADQHLDIGIGCIISP